MTSITYDPDTDYYQLLGIAETASTDEIRQAYRKLARSLHPDNFPNADETGRQIAEDRFKELNFANSVLSDDEQRKTYDELRLAYTEDLPPIPPLLRLSTKIVDFGTVSVGSHAPTTAVQMYNDGGDVASCQIIPDSGTFWTVVGALSDDPHGYGQYLFTLVVDHAISPGNYQDDIKIILDNGVDLSAQRLAVCVCIEPNPTRAASLAAPLLPTSLLVPPTPFSKVGRFLWDNPGRCIFAAVVGIYYGIGYFVGSMCVLILLVGIVLALVGLDPNKVSNWITNSILFLIIIGCYAGGVVTAYES